MSHSLWLIFSEYKAERVSTKFEKIIKFVSFNFGKRKRKSGRCSRTFIKIFKSNQLSRLSTNWRYDSYYTLFVIILIIPVDKDQAQQLIAAINELACNQADQEESSSEFSSLQREVTQLIVALWGSIEKIKSFSSNLKLTERETKKRLKCWIKENVL